MKRLLELEAKLRKAKEDLQKNMDMMGSSGMPGGTAADVNMAKEEHCSEEDKKADEKMIEEKLDEHNEKKHGEAKNTDSAKKSDIPKEITDQPVGDILDDQDKGPMEKGSPGEMIKFDKNGQWRMEKATMEARPNGEFDVPVKEVYDGDDEFVHVGNRGVDNEDKGKNQKQSDKEKDFLKN